MKPRTTNPQNRTANLPPCLPAGTPAFVTAALDPHPLRPMLHDFIDWMERVYYSGPEGSEFEESVPGFLARRGRQALRRAQRQPVTLYTGGTVPRSLLAAMAFQFSGLDPRCFYSGDFSSIEPRLCRITAFAGDASGSMLWLVPGPRVWFPSVFGACFDRAPLALELDRAEDFLSRDTTTGGDTAP